MSLASAGGPSCECGLRRRVSLFGGPPFAPLSLFVLPFSVRPDPPVATCTFSHARFLSQPVRFLTLACLVPPISLGQSQLLSDVTVWPR